MDLSDTRFTKVKIWLLHLHENLNGSYFEKSVVEDAVPSLSNTPILGYIAINSENEKDFSDHREVLIVENGDIKTKYLGKAVGVIPSDNNAKFEMRVCDDGIEREFLTVEGLLWTGKFDDVSEIMLRDEKKSQSIELDKNYSGEFEDDNLYHFSKFRFYGACILGNDLRPAMQNATVELAYSLKDFENEIQQRLEDYKNHMANQEEKINQSKEGKQMENKNAEKSNGQFSLSASQLSNELSNLVRVETFVDRWGDKTSLYSYYDHKDGEVYVYDKSDNWNLYGLNFATSGDKIAVDFNTKRRKKIEIVDFTDGEAVTPTFPLEMFTEIASDKEKEFAGQDSDTIFQLKGEIKQLKGALAKIETGRKNELFSQYANLNDIEAFENLKTNAENFSIDELTKEIKVIAFDNNITLEKFSAKQQQNTKQLIKTNFNKGNDDSTEKSPYGNLFEQYLN